MASAPSTVRVRLDVEAGRLRLPGLASAHSHAFQRALRGRTHRLPRAGREDFWSWRARMYRLAERLDPEALRALTALAYAELLSRGVTVVGEFHYLHHGPGGRPYADRLVCSEAIVDAAREVGVRVGLLRTLYHRAGPGRAPEGAQRRFADPGLEAALRDVEALQARHRGARDVRVGLALHSVRAVPRAWLREAAAFAVERSMVLHVHVSEQPGEVEQCLQEHGLRPVELLAEEGVLGPALVAVHATHLTDAEVRLLGEAEARVCLCRSTERDLGDGLPRVSDLLEAGVRLCLGVDGYFASDPFEEARAVEMDERSRAGRRAVVADGARLLHWASVASAEGSGFAVETVLEDEVTLDLDDPALALGEGVRPDDLAMFAGHGGAVREVSVAGRRRVEQGRHVAWSRLRTEAERALRRIGEAG